MRAHVVTGGIQFALLAVAVEAGSRALWIASLSLIGAASLVAWIATYRRLRLVNDTPTSTIAAAAQGYVELSGRCAAGEGVPTLARYSQLPCAWHRYQMEEVHGDHDHTVESGQSDSSFLIVDATGTCVIDPEGAEITTARKDSWVRGDYRYTEWILCLNEQVHVLGEFNTRFYQPSTAETSADLSALLAEWKRDRPGLLKRFDANNDGEIDLAEWEAVRQAARAEVEKNAGEMQAAPPMNGVRAPRDGRPYLISALPPGRRAWMFRLWIGVHLAVFIAAMGWLGKNLVSH